MAIKIENLSNIALPKGAEENIQKVLAFLPAEHLRGLEKIRLVDYINDPRLKNVSLPKNQDLPGLYHPKQMGKNAFLEISLGALLKPTESYFNRLMPRMSFKTNIAALIFSLVGQHYYLTLRHSVKRNQIEGQVRQYAEKNLKAWSEKQAANSRRARIFKPFRPILERWAKYLNKKAAEAQRKAKA
jgi:hypothetical protein